MMITGMMKALFALLPIQAKKSEMIEHEATSPTQHTITMISTTRSCLRGSERTPCVLQFSRVLVPLERGFHFISGFTRTVLHFLYLELRGTYSQRVSSDVHKYALLDPLWRPPSSRRYEER